MFIIATPDGPTDLDSEIGRQDRYNKFMSAILKEKEMLFYRMEIDFVEVKISFLTFQSLTAWTEIALSTGAKIVSLWYGDEVIGAYS